MEYWSDFVLFVLLVFICNIEVLIDIVERSKDSKIKRLVNLREIF